MTTAVNSSKKYVDLMCLDDYIRINREEESRPPDCDPRQEWLHRAAGQALLARRCGVRQKRRSAGASGRGRAGPGQPRGSLT